MVYYRYSWKVLWLLMTEGGGRFWDLDKIVAKSSEAQTGCPVTYSYGKNQFRQMFEKRGFQVLSVEADHIFPYNIPDYVEYRYKKVWYFRWMPKKLFRALERLFGWHLCLTAVAK